MIYLAQPYSHPDPCVRQQRYEAGCRAISKLMSRGLHIYGPIQHSHGIAIYGGLPTDWAFWEAQDRAILSVCKALWVLTLEGWKESKGVQAEIKIAIELELPVKYLNPTDLLIYE